MSDLVITLVGPESPLVRKLVSFNCCFEFGHLLLFSRFFSLYFRFSVLFCETQWTQTSVAT